VRLLRNIILLQFAMAFSLGQMCYPTEPARLQDRPPELVRRLYQQVIARHPGGIPKGEDMTVFAPYLSKALLKRMNLFLACNADWDRQFWDPDEPEKPPYEGVWESGIFSGGDERTAPGWFHVEGQMPEKDGSTRVYVKLTWHDSPPYHSSEVWQVAVILVHEDNHLAVDDIVYLKDKARPDEQDRRLSQSLSEDCDGPHWVGEGPYKPTPHKPLRERVMWVR
jgi:hypothetical protein